MLLTMMRTLYDVFRLDPNYYRKPDSGHNLLQYIVAHQALIDLDSLMELVLTFPDIDCNQRTSKNPAPLIMAIEVRLKVHVTGSKTNICLFKHFKWRRKGTCSWPNVS